MDLLEDTDLRRGHRSEAIHRFESYIFFCLAYDLRVKDEKRKLPDMTPNGMFFDVGILPKYIYKICNYM